MRGIVITFYVFDGLMAKALVRHNTARHELMYDSRSGIDFGEEHTVMWACDWVVGMKCVSHGLPNSVVYGLKHAIATLPNGNDDDVHIAIASLLNCRSAFQSKIQECLMMGNLRFRKDRSGTCNDIRAYWLSLRVDPSMLDVFVDLDFSVDPATKCVDVDGRFENDASVVQKVVDVMLYCYRCRN